MFDRYCWSYLTTNHLTLQCQQRYLRGAGCDAYFWRLFRVRWPRHNESQESIARFSMAIRCDARAWPRCNRFCFADTTCSVAMAYAKMMRQPRCASRASTYATTSFLSFAASASDGLPSPILRRAGTPFAIIQNFGDQAWFADRAALPLVF